MSKSWCVGDAKSFSVVPTFTRPELACWILYCIISEGMSAVSPSLSIETTWPSNKAFHQTQPVSHNTASTHSTRHIPVAVYGCATWSLTLWEERRLRVIENRMMKISGPKREENTEQGKNCILRSFMISTAHQMLFRCLMHGWWAGRGMWYIQGRRGNLKGRHHLENQDIHGRILVKWILTEQDIRVRPGLIWLKTGTIGGLLWTR